jgi:hypothetical protein
MLYVQKTVSNLKFTNLEKIKINTHNYGFFLPQIELTKNHKVRSEIAFEKGGNLNL